ncbi:MAG: alkane 1-monooxygenase, partial [Bacteroidota bacterium]
MKSLKYFAPIILYIISLKSFWLTGIAVWLPVIYSFGLIPLLELLLKPNHKNLSQAEEDLAKTNKWYDYMLYLIVPLQFIAIYLFLIGFSQTNLNLFDIAGRIASMGVLCGTFGINVGHELGHRTNIWEQRMAKVLLMSSLYMHFFVEHNKGHHKNVATLIDPASARFNEPVYLFYFRSIFYSYLSAWQIANLEMRKKGFKVFSFQNEMVQFHLIEIAFLLIVGFVFGLKITLYFMIAALIGILMLETVNYIEHYGLQRKRSESGNYERTIPSHSWNSDHILGRILLFELSRHSDHHYMASRKYQILKS